MKIATWNLERLIKNNNQTIIEIIKNTNADIFVLTETNSCIELEGYDKIQSKSLPQNYDGINYKQGENRTTIWTKYRIKRQHQTYDKFTSVCCDLETPFGDLTIYGTIIGIFANKQPRFDNDLKGQTEDFEKIFNNRQVCIIGDLNVMFFGFAYPSHNARNILNSTFEKFDLTNTTEKIERNVDHIVFSKNYLSDKEYSILTWNNEKKYSDHLGHCLTIKAKLG